MRLTLILGVLLQTGAITVGQTVAYTGKFTDKDIATEALAYMTIITISTTTATIMIFTTMAMILAITTPFQPVLRIQLTIR